MSNLLIVVAGPTAVGKTDFSVELARRYNTSIISSDSRQIYKELTIGTAVPAKDILQEIPHYFIHSHSITQYYNASMYELAVLDLLKQLFRHTPVVILCGGSGLYTDAVCFGIDDLPEIDPEIRTNLMTKFKQEGIDSLRLQLKTLDPVYYKTVDLQNPKRILKALEVSLMSGKPYSSLLTHKPKKRPFNILFIGLNLPRHELFSQINQRVDEMIANGLVDEARSLYPTFISSHPQALNTVGYKELFSYFAGEITLNQAIVSIKSNTRKYARKQITYFNKNKQMKWFHPLAIDSAVRYIESAGINNH